MSVLELWNDYLLPHQLPAFGELREELATKDIEEAQRSHSVSLLVRRILMPKSASRKHASIRHPKAVLGVISQLDLNEPFLCIVDEEFQHHTRGKLRTCFQAQAKVEFPEIFRLIIGRGNLVYFMPSNILSCPTIFDHFLLLTSTPCLIIFVKKYMKVSI